MHPRDVYGHGRHCACSSGRSHHADRTTWADAETRPAVHVRTSDDVTITCKGASLLRATTREVWAATAAGIARHRCGIARHRCTANRPRHGGTCLNNHRASADGTLFPVRRLTVAVPSVRGFQRSYERAVPAVPREDVGALVRRRAPWSEMIQLVANSAPPQVLDLLQERRAPGNAARRRQCRLHRVPDGQPHDRGADVSARPARDAPFAAAHRDMGRLDRRRPVQRRSAQTQFKSFGVPEISKVGVELDRKPAALLDALDVDVSRALLES